MYLIIVYLYSASNKLADSKTQKNAKKHPRPGVARYKREKEINAPSNVLDEPEMMKYQIEEIIGYIKYKSPQDSEAQTADHAAFKLYRLILL